MLRGVGADAVRYARITAVDQQGRAFVERRECRRSVVRFRGGFRTRYRAWGRMDASFCWCSMMATSMSSETFLLTDWMHHTPKEVLAKNFDVPRVTFDKCAEERVVHLSTTVAASAGGRKRQAEAVTGLVPNTFDFFTSQMQPTKVSKGGEVKIVDRRNFPATDIAAAIVTLKPGGLRELHWHPNEDEWQYYVRERAG